MSNLRRRAGEQRRKQEASVKVQANLQQLRNKKRQDRTIARGSTTMVHPEEKLPCWANSSVAALYNNGDYPGKKKKRRRRGGFIKEPFDLHCPVLNYMEMFPKKVANHH